MKIENPRSRAYKIVSMIILVILVQIIQSIGTALSVKSDRRINQTESKRRKST